MNQFFSEFHEPDHQEWLKIVERELKTALESYEITHGLSANPFVGNTSDSILSEFRKRPVGWTIFQEVRGISSVEINSKILEALEGGASGISLTLDSEELDFEVVFRDVFLSFIQIRFYFSDDFFGSDIFFDRLSSFCDGRKVNFVFAGLTKEETKKASAFGKIEITTKKDGPLIQNISDTLREAESLAFSEKLDLVISLQVQENFYLNIVQHKAFKIIWTKLAEAYQKPESEILLCSRINLSHSDPNFQVIAATQQIASSVFGGSDAVAMQNIPFDSEKYSENFSARITRNIQNILWNESFLHRVNDPSRGSYFIDDLCRKMINEVWTLFVKDK